MHDVKDLLDGGDSKHRVNGMGCDVIATRKENAMETSPASRSC